MKLPRRQFLHLAWGAAALSTLSRIAMADTYPSRPVRLIVGFPAGYATDIVARLVAQSLSERLGQQVFVENHPGAATNIAVGEVVNAAPDGYTLLAMTVTNAVNATLYRSLRFDIIHDIAPIAATFRSPNVLVVTLSLPTQTLPEFIAYAKANPGKINYASAGYGTAPNVNAELFKMMTGVDLVHVPYSGSFLPDLLSGQVQCAFPPIPLAIANIRAGKLRALAVTSATRSDARARRSGCGRICARIRGLHLARNRCTKEHTSSNHQQAQSSDQRRPRRSQDKRAVRRYRRYTAGWLAS